MDRTHFTWSADLPPWAGWAAVTLWLLSLVLLGLELRRLRGGRWLVGASGVLASTSLLLAVARPAHVTAKESSLPPRITVLVDDSHSMRLPQGGERRDQVADRALAALLARKDEARFEVRGFSQGPAHPIDRELRAQRSDLSQALRAELATAQERADAFVVISDGALTDPAPELGDEALHGLLQEIGVPISTLAVGRESPKDAAITHVSAAQNAVAHAPLPVRVEVRCSGGLRCDDLTVTARELREEGPAALLASGVAKLQDGHATVELSLTLDRAGSRVVQFAIDAPPGDEILANNTRALHFEVARERVRILHVAGRPTQDVRALRGYLKQNASVDVVAFFILRTMSDFANATPDELALIEFPVNELFSEHLPSFDAVVLQDFDAEPYGLARHLPALERYVHDGGGLVMVGGVNSFVAGGYADTPLARVLPVALQRDLKNPADVSYFEPTWTRMGQDVRLLAPLREIVGTELPSMPGANLLGDALPGALVLWTHPRQRTASGAPMPVLALREVGNGRSLALGLDGSWRLEFSALGARTNGRGYAALWDGLLGWLMRDPRYEPSQIELRQPCLAELPTALRIGPLPEDVHAVQLHVRALEGTAALPAPVRVQAEPHADRAPLELELPALPAGNYLLEAQLTGGEAHHGEPRGSTLRKVLACELGGAEWAHTEVHPEHLARLSRASQGKALHAAQAASLPLPSAAVISSERRVAAIAPPWLWVALAALTSGGHWYLRRTRGLS